MTLHSSRPDARTDLVHGTLDMLILRTLQWGAQHGYAIGQTIRAQSSDVLQVEASRLSLESQLTEARGKLDRDTVALFKALGGGWPELAQGGAAQ